MLDHEKKYWKTATVVQSHSSWTRMWPRCGFGKSDNSTLHPIFELRRSVNNHGVVYRANDFASSPVVTMLPWNFKVTQALETRCSLCLVF